MAVERTDDNGTGGTGRAEPPTDSPAPTDSPDGLDGPGTDVTAPDPTPPVTVAPDAPDPKIAAAVAAAKAAAPQNGESVRTDSWIWSVRLVKTRSAGATACRGGHVHVNGDRVKPAHSLRVGDEVRVRQDGLERIVVVKHLIRKRVGAPVAAQCYVDKSPPPPPREAFAPAGVRDRGAGRPTKRDRRDLERLRGLTEGSRRNRFAGPGDPGGPGGSETPADPDGSATPARADAPRRADKAGHLDRARRSDRSGTSGKAGNPGRGGSSGRTKRSN
ncbi:RNA-binding S4 domain-containing protein [Streptomyces sp. NBC_00285]|uniref:RNA-binding S4 domain-containing protein n=1 Tax=Streptomyces sp. NBC_00285 TaxID=2975700 RepID=UPI002E28DAF4|nr:RNA-binding S4 domain-containing protein [Streptomyces sp. NBC_00285]